MSTVSGVAEVVGGAVDAARAAHAGASVAEQPMLDLSTSEDHLPLPDASEIYAIADADGCTISQAVEEWERRGRKGRKPGAKNRSTEDFERYMLGLGPHPGAVLMRFMQPVPVLAALLNCKKIEAAELQRKIATDLLPYFQGKKPVSVELSGGVSAYIMPGMPGLDGRIVGLASAAAAEAGQPIDGLSEFGPIVVIAHSETEANQVLSDARGTKSE